MPDEQHTVAGALAWALNEEPRARLVNEVHDSSESFDHHTTDDDKNQVLVLLPSTQTTGLNNISMFLDAYKLATDDTIRQCENLLKTLAVAVHKRNELSYEPALYHVICKSRDQAVLYNETIKNRIGDIAAASDAVIEQLKTSKPTIIELAPQLRALRSFGIGCTMSKTDDIITAHGLSETLYTHHFSLIYRGIMMHINDPLPSIILDRVWDGEPVPLPEMTLSLTYSERTRLWCVQTTGDFEKLGLAGAWLQHPHCIKTTPCLGSFESDFYAALGSGDLISAGLVFKMFLEEVDGRDEAGKFWPMWLERVSEDDYQHFNSYLINSSSTQQR